MTFISILEHLLIKLKSPMVASLLELKKNAKILQSLRDTQETIIPRKNNFPK